MPSKSKENLNMALQQDTKKKTAVLAFGRMNPPTTGHEKLINKTHQVAKQHGGTAHVVATHSHDNKKNPLPQDKKLGYLRKIAHPDVKVSGSSKENPSIHHKASELHAAGHTHLVVVAGGGREKEFHDTLKAYNGKTSKHGHYNFKKISVVSSGKRDPDSHGTEGISGTKMRHYAKSGQHDKFKQGLPKALHPHAKEIQTHAGGTQLESFKEAMMKKKFKPSGDKTEVITHTMPQSTGGGKGSVGSSGGKGAPANTTRSGGQRFGEGANRYMRMVNAEFEDFTGGSLDEVLSRQARIKKALILRRFKHKIQRRKAIMRKKLATPDMIRRRARRHAIKLVRVRFMGKKGKDYAKLGMADKIMIDTRVATKKKIIDRIAQRLLPKVRRAELVRLRTMNKKKTAPKQKVKKLIQAPKRPPTPSPQKYVPLKPTTAIKAKSISAVKAKPTSSSPTSSYTIPTNVKTEEVMSIVDMLSILTEKDQKALENKINSSDIDSDILFEVFAMGLEGEGPQTPQQQGFMSLNTFIADNYKSAAIAEQRENKIIEAEEEYQDLVGEAMREWDGEEISGVQLDRRYNRPMVSKSTLPRLKEFKATGEDSSVEDPIDPKKVKHDHEKGIIKKKNKLKRLKDEALSYPHETAKQYKKDTPGQNNEDLQQAVKKAKVLGFLAKQKLKQKARQLKKTMSVPKPATPQYEDVNAMFEALLSDKEVKQKHDDRLKNVVKNVKRSEYNLNRRIKRVVSKLPHNQTKSGGVQNEDVDVNRDPNHAHIKKMGYKVQHGHGLNAKDPRHKQNHSKPDVTLHYTMGDTDSSAYTVHKGGAAHGDPKMHRVAKPKTKVGGVQNEDAGAMQRVAQAQVGQRDRLRQQHEREMEQMDNSEEKKKKREAFVKSMAGLKVRQQARKETARARLPSGIRGTR